MFLYFLLVCLLAAFSTFFPLSGGLTFTAPHNPRYLILFIGDGMGENQIKAASLYTSQPAPYHDWFQGWVSTYPDGGFYDPQQAWTSFAWVNQNEITDSAAAATAIYSGNKTANGRISVSPDGSMRYRTITEDARQIGLSVGAVTSVPISHATPGAWIAHNDWRQNGFAIANEGIWGQPNTTGDYNDPFYGGSHGSTLPPVDVLIGGGHPHWFTSQNYYVDEAIRQKLLIESNQSTKPYFIERVAGNTHAGEDLLKVAADPSTVRIVGLYGGTEGNLEFRLADGTGANPENPTLPEMTTAAIQILNRNPKGFILLVEGGAIDFASHHNNMDQLIGEVIDFNAAVQAAIDWVDDPSTAADWSNTLLVVTADHETGYLTAAPNRFPDVPLGEVSSRTLQLEKSCQTTCLKASWEDENNNHEIDATETVYWAWNSTYHTNSLVPLYLRGKISTPYSVRIRGYDPHRGPYIDNTDLYSLLKDSLFESSVFLPLVFR